MVIALAGKGRAASTGARPWRWGVTLALVMLLSWLWGPQAAPAQAPVREERVAILLDIDGAIGPATVGYLRQGFEAARARGAELVILRMDTPGGLDAAMRDIIRDILALPVPVITYVAPHGARAASAGTYILYASHLAAMAPGTNLGAATPVQLGGGSQPLDAPRDDKEADQPPADASAMKAVNDAAAYIRSLAELRGRNADWAEEAVRRAASLSATAALERGVIEIVATDLDDLLAKADGRTVHLDERTIRLRTLGTEIVPVAPDWRMRVLAVITDPNVALILMLIGIYGIIFEFMSPGAVAPGVVGAIALLTGLFALNLLPVNYAGIGLLTLGIALMTAEAFTPAFGVLGLGGAAAFALGALMLFEEAPGFEISLPVVLTATVASAAFLAIVLAAAVRAHRLRVATGDAALVGSIATVADWSGNGGHVRVHGELWQASAMRPLSPGGRVRVIGRDGLRLVVEPADQ